MLEVGETVLIFRSTAIIKSIFIFAKTTGFLKLLKDIHFGDGNPVSLSGTLNNCQIENFKKNLCLNI